MKIYTVLYGDRGGERYRASFVHRSNEFLCHKQNPSLACGEHQGGCNE